MHFLNLSSSHLCCRKSKTKPNGKKPPAEEKKQYLEPEFTKIRVVDFDLKELVVLPREIDLNEWLASNSEWLWLWWLLMIEYIELKETKWKTQTGEVSLFAANRNHYCNRNQQYGSLTQSLFNCEKGAHYLICDIKIPLFKVFLRGLELFFQVGMHLSSGDDEMFQWCWSQNP